MGLGAIASDSDCRKGRQEGRGESPAARRRQEMEGRKEDQGRSLRSLKLLRRGVGCCAHESALLPAPAEGLGCPCMPPPARGLPAGPGRAVPCRLSPFSRRRCGRQAGWLEASCVSPGRGQRHRFCLLPPVGGLAWREGGREDPVKAVFSNVVDQLGTRDLLRGTSDGIDRSSWSHSGSARRRRGTIN